MPDNAIAVLTFKSVETILQTGGTQSWALQRSRARACKYAVVCRNANTRIAEGNEPHGTCFMIGRISDVVPSTESDGRWLIKFSEYALCGVPDQWEGRNPVAYYTTDQYTDIDFDHLQFVPMPSIRNEAKGPLTIAAAKTALAHSFGVSESAIDITIRG